MVKSHSTGLVMRTGHAPRKCPILPSMIRVIFFFTHVDLHGFTFCRDLHLGPWSSLLSKFHLLEKQTKYINTYKYTYTHIYIYLKWKIYFDTNHLGRYKTTNTFSVTITLLPTSNFVLKCCLNKWSNLNTFFFTSLKLLYFLIENVHYLKLECTCKNHISNW